MRSWLFVFAVAVLVVVVGRYVSFPSLSDGGVSSLPMASKTSNVTGPAKKQAEREAALPRGVTPHGSSDVTVDTADPETETLKELASVATALSFDGRLDEARVKLDELRRLAPYSREYAEAVALVYLSFLDAAEPERATIQRCLELYPDSSSCHFMQISIEGRFASHDRALAAAEKCLERLPDDRGCQSLMAMARLNLGDFAAAAETFRNLIRTSALGTEAPFIKIWSYELGEALLGLQRPREAYASFRSACEARYVDSCDRLGAIQKQM